MAHGKLGAQGFHPPLRGCPPYAPCGGSDGIMLRWQNSDVAPHTAAPVLPFPPSRQALVWSALAVARVR